VFGGRRVERFRRSAARKLNSVGRLQYRRPSRPQLCLGRTPALLPQWHQPPPPQDRDITCTKANSIPTGPAAIWNMAEHDRTLEMGCRTRVPVRTSMMFTYEPDENAVSHRLACEYCMFVMACLSYASFLFPLPVTTSAHKHAAATEGPLAPCYPVDRCFRWLLGAVSETTRLLLLHRFGAWAPWLDCVYARSVGQRLSLSP
jgi:hypothetical protein